MSDLERQPMRCIASSMHLFVRAAISRAGEGAAGAAQAAAAL